MEELNMKHIKLALIFQFISFVAFAQSQNKDWPVLKTYDQQHIQKIKMPVGGIGTGTISLTGRGSLEDWEIMNRPAKGFELNQTFFLGRSISTANNFR